MKKTLSLIALATAASFAADIKYGLDAAGQLTMPSLDVSGMDATLGFGGKVAGAAEYGINEQLALRGSLGYLLTTWGEEMSVGGSKMTFDAVSHFISIGAGAQYKVIPTVQLRAGLGVDIPVMGTYESETTINYGAGSTTVKDDGDIKDTNVQVAIEAGAGYVMSDALSVNALYRLAVTEYGDKTKLNGLQLGVSYNF